MARGSVYRRGDRYYIRYDVEPDPLTGRRRQRSGDRGGYASEGEADRALALALATVFTGRHVDDTRQTLRSYAAYWLDVVKPGSVRDSTLNHYRRQLERHILPALGAHRLLSLRPAHVNQAMRQWEHDKLAGTTAAALSATLRQILTCAVREQVLARHPMESIRRPRPAPAERTWWTPQQMSRCLALAAADPFYPLWRLYIMSGLRRNEALGLRWCDVEWKRERIRVEQQVTYEHKVLDFGPPKNRRGRRVVDLDGETMAQLRRHRALQAEKQLAHPAWHDHDLVFPDYDGRPFIPGTIGSKWESLMHHACADLPYISLHGVRHSHASALMQEDGNVAAIAQRMGHDPAMLLRTYSHVADGVQRRAVNRLLAAFAAPAEERKEE